MIFYIDNELAFPPVELANDDGLLCFGGDLSPERLILAYKSGIFPWADDPILWFSPDPRMIIDLKNWQPSKSLLRTFKKGTFQLKIDHNFNQVIEMCASTRESTWISEEFIYSYCKIHKMGLAHSFEVYRDNELVGGLYGLSLGDAFCGESMFHKVTDASKIAFMHLVLFLRHHKFSLLDCQVSNPHLVRLGGIDITRQKYIQALKKSLQKDTRSGNWGGPMLKSYLAANNQKQ